MLRLYGRYALDMRLLCALVSGWIHHSQMHRAVSLYSALRHRASYQQLAQVNVREPRLKLCFVELNFLFCLVHVKFVP